MQKYIKLYQTYILQKPKAIKTLETDREKKHVHRATLKLTLAFSIDKKAEGNEMSRQRWETK